MRSPTGHNWVEDIRGRKFEAGFSAQRLVSLVPSITETLFDFGCAERLVARTDYCVHPAAAQHILSIGGTKNPDLDAIRALRPHLVFANQEENRKASVDALEANGIPVFLTFPRTVAQAISDLQKIATLLGVYSTAYEIVESITELLRHLKQRERSTVPVFVPIWRESLKTQPGDVWMTFNAETYTHDLLSVLGLHNVFASRERKYPLAADLNRAEAEETLAAGRDTRYPRVTLDEVAAQRPDLVLLPDEPYEFGDVDADDIAATLELPREQVHLIDGSLLFWHGTRMRRALRGLTIDDLGFRN